MTTGTFLSARCHIGGESLDGGRYFRDSDTLEPSTKALAVSLRDAGIPIGRLRTGTPPRLSKKSINFNGFEE